MCKVISLVLFFATLPSPALAQALSGTLADLDAATIAAMRARTACDAPRDAAWRLACDGLAAFAKGEPLDGKLLDGKHLIGAGAAVSGAGAVAPSLELVVFGYRRERNFHASVELGDSVAAVPVKPENADEAKVTAEAAAQVATGKTPRDNNAFEFARTMNVETKMVRTRLTSGKSVGLDGTNRRLLRRSAQKLVLIELPFENSHVAGKPFWVQVFDLR